MSAQRDRYQSLAALMSDLKENREYRIRYRNRRSKVTIISPHGGYIEAGTSAIGRAVAGRSFNHFDFQGLQHQSPADLHVTSTRFRHPVLTQMLEQSALAVSIHGMGFVDSWNIWLGGLNTAMKKRMEEALREQGFSVVSRPPKYKGESPQNFVNLPSAQGVQLELPADLIAQMFTSDVMFSPVGDKPQTTELFDRFVKTVRGVVSAEVKSITK